MVRQIRALYSARERRRGGNQYLAPKDLGGGVYISRRERVRGTFEQQPVPDCPERIASRAETARDPRATVRLDDDAESRVDVVHTAIRSRYTREHLRNGLRYRMKLRSLEPRKRNQRYGQVISFSILLRFPREIFLSQLRRLIREKMIAQQHTPPSPPTST